MRTHSVQCVHTCWRSTQRHPLRPLFISNKSINTMIANLSNSLAFSSSTISIISPAASSSWPWSAKLERVGATGVSGGPTDGVVDEVAGDDVENCDAE